MLQMKKTVGGGGRGGENLIIDIFHELLIQ